MQSHSKTMAHGWWPFAVAGLACAHVASFTLALRAEQDKTSKDAVFSAAQAKRGETVYQDQCAPCHSDDLSGGAGPALVGADFFLGWDKMPVSDLVTKIATSMPSSAPGSLKREQTVDLVAFILQSNKFPAGETDLPGDEAALKAITIVK